MAREQEAALRWVRSVATALAITALIYAAWSVWIIRTNPMGVDFISFWSAARLTLQGEAALAYDIAAHRSVETANSTITGLMPFPYPPPFLMFVLPFGLLPFWLGMSAWIVLTGGLYVLAARRLAPLPYSLAHPPVVANVFIGQNGLLTGSIFLFAASAIERRPFVAGLIFGLLVIKPQLALLIPVALLAAQAWTAIAGAALAAAGLLLLALILFGFESYVGFFGILPFYASIIRDAQLPWNELASPFAFLRHVGVSQGIALGVHSGIALIAAAVTWQAWARGAEEKVAILAAATMLIPPYLFTYDAVLMIAPLGVLLSRRRLSLAAIVWFCCFLPIVTYFRYYPGPNPIPVAAMLSLWALRRAPRVEKASLNRHKASGS